MKKPKDHINEIESTLLQNLDTYTTIEDSLNSSLCLVNSRVLTLLEESMESGIPANQNEIDFSNLHHKELSKLLKIVTVKKDNIMKSVIFTARMKKEFTILQEEKKDKCTIRFIDENRD